MAPLAFMRGRTLTNAVVLLDEAQNTTSMQMKMVLTRLGEGSRMIITGDPSQIDLPHGQKSGLVEAARILARLLRGEVKPVMALATPPLAVPIAVQKTDELFMSLALSNLKKI